MLGRRRVGAPLEILGASSAAGLGAIDVIFSLRGQIAKTYLLDAAVEAVIPCSLDSSAVQCVGPRAESADREFSDLAETCSESRVPVFASPSSGMTFM